MVQGLPAIASSIASVPREVLIKYFLLNIIKIPSFQRDYKDYLTNYDHPGFVDGKHRKPGSFPAKVQSTTLELSKAIIRSGLNHMQLCNYKQLLEAILIDFLAKPIPCI